MMAVIVKGMDMPEDCASCDFRVDGIGNIHCGKTYSRIGITCACYERMKDCPLRSVEGLIEQIRRQEFAHFTDNGGYYMTPAEIKDVLETIIKKYCGLEE